MWVFCVARLVPAARPWRREPCHRPLGLPPGRRLLLQGAQARHGGGHSHSGGAGGHLGLLGATGVVHKGPGMAAVRCGGRQGRQKRGSNHDELRRVSCPPLNVTRPAPSQGAHSRIQQQPGGRQGRRGASWVSARALGESTAAAAAASSLWRAPEALPIAAFTRPLAALSAPGAWAAPEQHSQFPVRSPRLPQAPWRTPRTAPYAARSWMSPTGPFSTANAGVSLHRRRPSGGSAATRRSQAARSVCPAIAPAPPAPRASTALCTQLPRRSSSVERAQPPPVLVRRRPTDRPPLAPFPPPLLFFALPADQMCLWCYHHILEEATKASLAARCPNCRAQYDEEKVQMQHIDAEQ